MMITLPNILVLLAVILFAVRGFGKSAPQKFPTWDFGWIGMFCLALAWMLPTVLH